MASRNSFDGNRIVLQLLLFPLEKGRSYFDCRISISTCHIPFSTLLGVAVWFIGRFDGAACTLCLNSAQTNNVYHVERTDIT